MNILPRFLTCVPMQFTRNACKSFQVSAALQKVNFGEFATIPVKLHNHDNLFKDFVRFYAKSKDKGKDKGKASGSVPISPSLISSVLDYDKIKSQFEGVTENMKEDFAKNLSLRSAVGTIESLKVPYEGKDYELQELAQIVRKNPKTIVLNMTAFPQAIPDILKAVQNSGLNLNPQQDGTTVFLPIPKVTKEHRDHLIKNANILHHKHRDMVKQLNLYYMKEIKNKKGISEDILRSVQAQINAMTELWHSDTKKILNAKISELSGKD